MSEESTETNVEETVMPATAPQTMNDLKPKMKLTGTVARLELYGAFIDIGVGVNALIHISRIGQEHINRVSDVLNLGDEVTVWIEKVDPNRNQIMVTMIEPLAVDWNDLKNGQVYNGKIIRLETYGAFIDIGAEREGLVHISELSHEFVKHPGEILKVGDEIDVQVLGFSRRKRRIDLSIKALLDKPEEVHIPSPSPKIEDFTPSPPRKQQKQKRQQPQETVYEFEDEDDGEMPTAMEIAMRKAMGDNLPVRGKQSKSKKRDRGKRREQQEDILNRTLQMQQES